MLYVYSRLNTADEAAVFKYFSWLPLAAKYRKHIGVLLTGFKCYNTGWIA